MNSKTLSIGLIILGLILTISPPIYLYETSYIIKQPIANTTFTLNSQSGILFAFHASKGDSLALVVKNTASSNESVLITRITGPGKTGIILQDKVEKGNSIAYKLVLANSGDYSLYLLNPVNTSTTGYIVAALEKKTTLTESPKATTFLIISVVGGIILGFGAGYKPVYNTSREALEE